MRGERPNIMWSRWPVVTVLLLVACGGDTVPSATDEPIDPPRSATSVDGDDPSTTTDSDTIVSVATTTTSPLVTVPPTTSRSITVTQPPPETPVPTPPSDDVIDSMAVRFALDDLRNRLDDPDADIAVVSVEEVDWPDGSLGCPQPGMVYTQAIVNGSKIVLSHDGILYHYHQAAGRDPFYCAPGAAVDK